KRAALRDPLIERSLAVDLSGGIEGEIDCQQIARGTHRYADHGVGGLLPPREDLRLIPRRILEAVGENRLLLDRSTRQDRDASSYVMERGLEHGGNGLCLGHYAILPPSLENSTYKYSRCLIVSSFGLSR